MSTNTREGRFAVNVQRWTSQRLLLQWMLLLATGIILFSDGPAVTGKCMSGFASLNPMTLSALPSNSSAVTSKSIIECIAMCTRDATCRQLIYVPINGTCYILRSPELSAIAWNTAGRWLFSVPNKSSDYVVTLSAVDVCPPPSTCISDCSSSADSTCSSDSVQYAGNPQVEQMRHYYSNGSNDNSYAGQVQIVYFNKLRSDTALRVQWRAMIRLQYMSTNSCGRYYATFNGAECSHPSTIDITGSDQTPNNEHRTSELDGICFVVPAGNITIAINVGPCPGYSVSYLYTGYLYGMNTWIWEISPSVTSSRLPCESLSVDNIQYQANSDEVTVDPDNVVTTMMYNKRATDTLLKVTWLAATRVFVQVDIPYCARWYVTVNDSECTPRADYIISAYSGTYNYTRANTKTRTLEGYCYGLEAGLYMIVVRVGSCQNETTLPDTNAGGSSSVSRFIVSEVRVASQMQSVQTSAGNTIKIPFFNVRHWTWRALNSDIKIGTILGVIYNKLSNSSGLHVRLLADMRVTSGSCRWFFTINGRECSSPGPIEGGAVINREAYYNQPGVVDGVCYGQKSGSYNISLKVTLRSGIDCYTGFESTTQLIVQEIQQDSAIICPSAKTCV